MLSMSNSHIWALIWNSFEVLFLWDTWFIAFSTTEFVCRAAGCTIVPASFGDSVAVFLGSLLQFPTILKSSAKASSSLNKLKII